MIERRKNIWRRRVFFSSTVLILIFAFLQDGFLLKHNSHGIYSKVSEELVLGRLAQSKIDGPFSYAGLTGVCHNKNLGQGKKFDLNYCKGFQPYKTHPGIHAQLYYFMGLIRLGDYDFYRLFSAVISAFVLGVIMIWVVYEFNFVTAILFLILFLTQRWPILLGDNIFLLTGFTYLPFSLSLWYFLKKQENTTKYYVSLLISFFVVWCFSGAEFITCTIMMPFVSLLYYAIKDKYSIKYFIQQGFAIGGVIISSLLLIGGVLFLQISSIEQSFIKAFHYFIFTIGKRTILTENITQKQGGWDNIDYISTWSVLENYLSLPAIHIGHISVSFQTILLFFTLITIFSVIKYFFYPDKRLQGLLITFWISIVSPLFWICFLKGHSYYHPFMDPIVWYMPFILLGMILVGFICTEWNKKKM